MADDLDMEDIESDDVALQRFQESQTAAKARDEQARFAETTAIGGKLEAGKAAGAKTPPGGSAGAGMSAGAEGEVEETPLSKFSNAVNATTTWVTRLPRNIGLGTLDAAVSTVKAPFDVLKDPHGGLGSAFFPGLDIKGSMEETEAEATGETAPSLPHSLNDTITGWDASYTAWRESLREDDTLADSLTQGVAQFAVPFTGFSKALGVSREIGAFSNTLRLAGADAAASFAAFEPDSGRAADLIQLGLHAENKFGDVLRKLAPDGSVTNQYIEWMTDHENETALGGRFKNTIDGLGVSAAFGALIKSSAGVFKIGRKGVEALSAPRPAKSGVEPVGAAARETHTGLVFEDPKDAESAVEELAHRHGPGFEQRVFDAHAKASDKNFATLHSFANVLKANPDKPVKTHSLIEALHKHIKGDTEEGAFYKELLGRLKSKNLGGTTTVRKGKLGSQGQTSSGLYNVKTNTIEISDGAFVDGPKRLLHVFAHEAVHKATAREMRESPVVYRKISGLWSRLTTAADNALHDERAAYEAKREAGTLPKGSEAPSRPYGFTSPDEFVAEIESNHEFRKLMKATMIDGESAWDRYKKLIGGILGLGALAASPEFDKLMDPKQEEDNA